jgi:hypothetical protein
MSFSPEEKQNIMWAAFSNKVHIIDNAPLCTQYMPSGQSIYPPFLSLEDPKLLRGKDDNGRPLIGSYAGKTIVTETGSWKAFIRIPLESFNGKKTLWRCSCKDESHPLRPSVSIQGEYGEQPLGNVLIFAHPLTRGAIGALHSPLAPVLNIKDVSGKLSIYRKGDWIIDPSKEFVILPKGNGNSYAIPKNSTLLLSFWGWSPPPPSTDDSKARLAIPRPLSNYRSVEKEADYIARKGTLSTLKPLSYTQEELIAALCHTVRGQELRIQELHTLIKKIQAP